MAFERYANLCSTTLTAGYTAGAGSITVASTASPWPSSPVFRVYVSDATTGVVKVILKVTAVTDGTHWAVTAEGSDANAASSDVVKLSLTAGGMDAIRADLHQTGALASAVANKAGNLYLPNDGLEIYRDTGSVMVPWGPIWPLTDPALQTWTQTGFGSCTSDTTHGGVDINNPTAEGSFNIHALLKNTPSTPWHAEFGFVQVGNTGGNLMAGPCVSDGTKFAIYTSHFQAAAVQHVEFYASNATTYGGFTPINPGILFAWGPVIFVRLGDDGTNRTYDVSCDGFTWLQVGTEVRTANVTASKVGFYVNGGKQHIRCIHYKETA